jgi:hypothetical protein
MSLMCEKCWKDSEGDLTRYYKLIRSRSCTPEEQAGPMAEQCHACKRITRHPGSHICMNPECFLFRVRIETAATHHELACLSKGMEEHDDRADS